MSIGEVKRKARERLKGKWIDAMAFVLLWLTAVVFLQSLIQFPFSWHWCVWNFVFLVANILFGGSFNYIMALYFLRLVRGKRSNLSVFREMWTNFPQKLAVFVYYLIFILLGTFVTGMIVAFVCTDVVMLGYVVIGLMSALAFIVGIYFAPVWFVLVDDPKIDPWDAIKKSAAMMFAHEGFWVLLIFSFIGWMILAGFTFGLGFVALLPYIMATHAVFYEEIKPTLLSQLRGAGRKVSLTVKVVIREV